MVLVSEIKISRQNIEVLIKMFMTFAQFFHSLKHIVQIQCFLVFFFKLVQQMWCHFKQASQMTAFMCRARSPLHTPHGCSFSSAQRFTCFLKDFHEALHINSFTSLVSTSSSNNRFSMRKVVVVTSEVKEASQQSGNIHCKIAKRGKEILVIYLL